MPGGARPGTAPSESRGCMMDLATVDKLLTTTRSVRSRLDLTRPVDPAVIEECLEIAVQAPQGSNNCRYHFIVVTDPGKRRVLADLYRQAFEQFYPADRLEARRQTVPREVASWSALAKHFQDVPMLIIPCVEGRPEGLKPERLTGMYSNILPMAWSLMLALRARGVGAAWTTIALTYEKEVITLLGLPENLTAAAVLPVAYFKGDDFKPAKRVPARERTHWNAWGNSTPAMIRPAAVRTEARHESICRPACTRACPPHRFGLRASLRLDRRHPRHRGRDGPVGREI